MLHAEVSGCAKGEGGNRGVGTEKALIVAVVGYAVCAVGIIIDETEIVGCPGKDLGELAQVIKAVGYRPGSVGFVAVWRYWSGCLAVNDSIRSESGRGVNSKHCSETRGVYVSFATIALNGVLHPVEEECVPQEVEQLSIGHGRHIRLEIKEVEIGLVIDFFALRNWHFV